MQLERAFISAGSSLLVAGLGQLLQERRGLALWHFVEVISLLILAFVDASHRPMWVGLAISMNTWSVIDAFTWEIRRFQPRAT
jgi:hypothetical protein